MKASELKKLETAVGHTFTDTSLLQLAVTHSSFARETESQQSARGEEIQVGDNEQLEFLGDAVLGLVTSRELYERFPQYQEGQLSKLRGFLVSEKHLIVAAKKIKIGRYLRLGRGEELSGGRDKTALQVDALEALLAAMYLDAGLEKTRQFILERIIGVELRKLGRRRADSPIPVTDYKSALQELSHSMKMLQPNYVVVKEQGPQHKKIFTVEVRLKNEGGKLAFSAQAQGATKKKGEQAAAEKGLEFLRTLQKQKRARTTA